MSPKSIRVASWLWIPAVLALAGCKLSATADETNDELAQAAADQLEGIDDAIGNLARRSADGFEFAERTDRAACGSITFGACTDNTRVRNFGGCTLGPLTFTGTTTLTFNDGTVDADCLTAFGDTVDRKPNWTITGARGWTVAAQTTGTHGQRFTLTSGTEGTFENDGIRRFATDANGDVVTDITTKTTEAITVGPIDRDSRVVTGGKLAITNNLNGVVCTVAPSNLTWDGGCTCPESGMLDGNCSDGTTYTLEMGSCGTATLTAGGVSTSVDLRRCVAPPIR